ncbi:hypothetical protein [Mesorhizobium sp.]|uniref:hypothetical protein n=1 Tax=Mesorhizobium sp. TaxID=1871066 RepID=UPI000FE97D10|nr:hypothetical protein [Mesorhizobium sp.]RWD44070.1 MAG: hypothetical protein EOS35_18125 [Mesorhizobium sp.]
MGNAQPRDYNDRSDIEKILSQWKKLDGLLSRRDWSAAVVRAATATELTLNYAIRHEFRTRSQLDAAFVDSLLKWANGLAGKLDKLLLPLLMGLPRQPAVAALSGLAREINDRRNSIVHRGEFTDEAPAHQIIQSCRQFVEGVVNQYDPAFSLPALGGGARTRPPVIQP